MITGLLSVAAVLGGLVVLVPLAVRRFRGYSPARRGTQRIEILERAPLAPRQGVALVRIGSRHVLLGMGDGGVHTLLELDAADLETGAPAAHFPQVAGSDVAAQMLQLVRSAAPRARTVMRAMRRPTLVLLALCALLPRQSAGATPVLAQAAVAAPAAQRSSAVQQDLPKLDLRLGDNEASDLRVTGTVGSVVMIGMLAIIPALLLLMTSFTRILIVLHFLRQALGTQTAPPGQLLAALALMLTGFVMAPTLSRAQNDAVQPWLDGEITEGEMLKRGVGPFRDFMLAQTPERDLVRFVEMSGGPMPSTPEEVSLPVLVSAFATSELRAAFQMGFAIFLPFIVIDLVVSAVLTSMGMFMLPPTMIALPCKLLLFVLADGWSLLVQSLVASFR